MQLKGHLRNFSFILTFISFYIIYKDEIGIQYTTITESIGIKVLEKVSTSIECISRVPLPIRYRYLLQILNFGWY